MDFAHPSPSSFERVMLVALMMFGAFLLVRWTYTFSLYWLRDTSGPSGLKRVLALIVAVLICSFVTGEMWASEHFEYCDDIAWNDPLGVRGKAGEACTSRNNARSLEYQIAVLVVLGGAAFGAYLKVRESKIKGTVSLTTSRY